MRSLTNPHRKKQINEFRDVNHKIMDEYYDVVTAEQYTTKEKVKMEKFIIEDPYFYDPYIILADILENKEKWEEAKKF